MRDMFKELYALADAEDPDMDRINEILKQVSRPNIKLFAALPYNMIPKRLKEHEFMKRYELGNPVKIQNISTGFGDIRLDTCRDTLTTFYWTMNKTGSDYRNATEYIMKTDDGKLICPLFAKHKGQARSLAMYTVEDQKGRFPLILGGVYAVLPDPIDALNCFLRGNDEFRYTENEPGQIHLDELCVEPYIMLHSKFEDPDKQQKINKRIIDMRNEIEKDIKT